MLEMTVPRNPQLHCHRDVSKAGDARGAIDAAISNYGRLDILVSHAGVVFLGSDDSSWLTGERVLATGGVR